MKVWTIQNEVVVNSLKNDSFYQPNFEKSTYLRLMNPLRSLYRLILEAFNRCNDRFLPGVIFAMTDVNGEIADIDAFWQFTERRAPAIASMMKQLLKKEAHILELQYLGDFNPICIDINDFQLLMPPVMAMPPYTEEDIDRIIQNISRGVYEPSIFPSGVIQLHLPNITLGNVVNIYKVTANGKTETVSLTDESSQFHFDEELPF